MPIVKLKSEEVFGPVDSITGRHGAPDYRQARGVKFSAEGKVANAATDLSGSTYTLAEIPSTAILDPDCTIDLQNWGFTIAKIGIDSDTDALLSVADTGVLADVSKFTDLGLFGTKWNKPLWEQLGLAADPGGKIALKIFTEANAGGAGSAPFRIVWKDN